MLQYREGDQRITVLLKRPQRRRLPLRLDRLGRIRYLEDMTTTDLYETPLYPQSQSILHPFAWDELVCGLVGEGRRPAVHIWRHPQAFVVGLRDRKLPCAGQAMEWLRARGYSVGVRNSGGAAVPLDPGVVNISVVQPIKEGQLDFHDDFKRMVRLIQDSLKPWTAAAESGEIAGAYCPGDYDVSIGGRKFCGIAQRRRLKAFVVSAFIIVEGAGNERAQLVREFYDRAACGAGRAAGPHEGAAHPLVEPGVMGSLQELAGVPDAAAFTASLKRVLREQGAAERSFGCGDSLPGPEQLEAMIEQLRTRYDR